MEPLHDRGNRLGGGLDAPGEVEGPFGRLSGWRGGGLINRGCDNHHASLSLGIEDGGISHGIGWFGEGGGVAATDGHGLADVDHLGYSAALVKIVVGASSYLDDVVRVGDIDSVLDGAARRALGGAVVASVATARGYVPRIGRRRGLHTVEPIGQYPRQCERQGQAYDERDCHMSLSHLPLLLLVSQTVPNLPARTGSGGRPGPAGRWRPHPGCRSAAPDRRRSRPATASQSSSRGAGCSRRSPQRRRSCTGS